MDSIAQLTRIRKRAKVSLCTHAVRVQGSADYWGKVNLSNLRGKVDDGTIKGLSSHSLARLRDAIANSGHVSGFYRTYGVCLTIPWAHATVEDAQGVWRDWTHNLGRFLDLWQIGLIYRVELQTRGAAHWHFIAYLPEIVDSSALDSAFFGYVRRLGPYAIPAQRCNDGKRPMVDAGSGAFSKLHERLLLLLRCTWVDTVRRYHEGAASARALARLSRPDAEQMPPVKTYAYCFNSIALDGVKSGISYLASHTSKHKQAQLGWKGKQWGYLGKKWLASPVPVDMPADMSHDTRKRAYRLLRAWVRRNQRKSNWRVVRPSRWLVGDSYVFGGLTVTNTRTLYLFGLPPAVVRRAFDCAMRISG